MMKLALCEGSSVTVNISLELLLQSASSGGYVWQVMKLPLLPASSGGYVCQVMKLPLLPVGLAALCSSWIGHTMYY